MSVLTVPTPGVVLTPPTTLRSGPAYWWNGYRTMLRWHLSSLRMWLTLLVMIQAHVIPQCAMHVQRQLEVGPISLSCRVIRVRGGPRGHPPGQHERQQREGARRVHDRGSSEGRQPETIPRPGQTAFRTIPEEDRHGLGNDPEIECAIPKGAASCRWSACPR